jgi:two-component system cell cycle sensor histidine kinase PleC
MQSTEASGVRAVGVESRSSSASKGNSLAALAASISPLTYALALVALLAATLYILGDAARLVEIQRQHADLAELAAGQSPAAGAPRAIPTAFSVEPPPDGSDLPQHAAIAYGLAGLVIALGFRRRARPVPQVGTLHDLLATIPFGVACWNSEGRLVVANAQYRDRLNADPIDSRPGALYSASIRRLIQGGYLQLVREDAGSRILELHREDGSCLVVDERPLAGGGFVTLLTDVTERRATEDLLVSIREEQRVLARRYHEEKLRAEAASRSKTNFLAHISHDIRTPLNHIIGFAELMRHETYGPLGDEHYASYVDSIRMSGERLLSFFASILDFAELEGGQRVLREEHVAVDELLASATQRHAPRAQRKGIALNLGAPTGAVLAGDRFSLERMLGNLIDNAIQFTPAGGRVTIAAHAASDGVVLEVSDTGIGMPPERLSSLSQPFAYGDAALTRDREGAGLGLAIARTIAELSGGRLAIDSRPGLGTTVAVSLPLLHHDEATDVAA